MPHLHGKPVLKLWTRPDSYVGATFEDYYVGPKVHRDSGILQKSNFDTALKMLGGEGDGVRVANSSHWAVGWIDEIFVHKDATKKVAILEEILERLASYPVLDEDDYRAREDEDVAENYKDYGRDEALKILGLGEKLKKHQEAALKRAWFAAQDGSSDDPHTDEKELAREARRLGLVK